MIAGMIVVVLCFLIKQDFKELFLFSAKKNNSSDSSEILQKCWHWKRYLRFCKLLIDK